MLLQTALPSRLPAEQLAALRAQVAQAQSDRGPALPFGIPEIDTRLAGGGIAGASLHEIAAASAGWADDAAATLFAAGIAARFAAENGMTVLWALSRFDLYAPGLEQAGLGPHKILYAQAKKDAEILALAEDALRDGSLACVIAEVRSADQTATRRLQLAAADGRTPMLLYRRHRTRERNPLSQPSSAMTRWSIGAAPSERLPHTGVGRARWHVDLLRQRGGAPFSLVLEACDDQGRLALPAAVADRTAAPAGATIRAA
ncbi:ImuA family protein [Novosphingobium kaempferiae]|uniref:ImuA family protein n=1 Tax=Novosphingobium kaempferiae TaxID=2896849 RepID=UPI001E39CC2A|nr:protein ImuA [Novosphingobium kaempferiae]